MKLGGQFLTAVQAVPHASTEVFSTFLLYASLANQHLDYDDEIFMFSMLYKLSEYSFLI